jgi:hypothetical protein
VLIGLSIGLLIEGFILGDIRLMWWGMGIIGSLIVVVIFFLIWRIGAVLLYIWFYNAQASNYRKWHI